MSSTSYATSLVDKRSPIHLTIGYMLESVIVVMLSTKVHKTGQPPIAQTRKYWRV